MNGNGFWTVPRSQVVLGNASVPEAPLRGPDRRCALDDRSAASRTSAFPSTTWERGLQFFTIAILFAFLSTTAFAQAPANVLVACQGTSNCPQGGHNSPYTDLQAAIDDAVADAVTLDQQVLLLVVGGPWPGPYTIPADANVHILGVSFNSKQTITIVNPSATPTGGTFTLSFTNPLNSQTDTTTALDFDATAAEVQAALEALTTIGTGNVTVTGPDGGPFDVTFVGTLANVAVPLLVPDDSLLTPPEAFVLVLSQEGPFSVVIQGNGTGAAFTIDGSTSADRDAGVTRDRLIIEGLTITGGDQGVRINGGSFPATKIEPVLNRLYIRDNGDGLAADVSGVLVEGSAKPLIVNSSISANNGDGVRVDGAAADLTEVDILHCSIIGNDNNGVFVATGNNARVRNTLVYRNGSGAGEGGLVWADNPFIDPDSGPLDGLIPGVGTPIQVTITGTDFDQGGPTQVFFGPPNKPGTGATVNTQTDTQLVVDLPPAASGVPGPVDVYIRRGDGFELRVPNGFTYTDDLNGADPIPVVWQVDPGWGPIDNVATAGIDESAIDVYVLGAHFDKNCTVFFDINDNDVREANEQSPNVRWLSSGRLFVRVPRSTNPAKVDVWVVNPSGQASPLGPLEEYEYRAGFTGLGPDIQSIIPSSIDTTAGSGASTSSTLLPDIIGNNFQPGIVVKIGGIVCSYNALVGNNLIRDITVPVSQFGGGGVYDVEVVNPDGRNDVLPRAFTYFPASTPGLDLLPWRVSNFVERGTPTTLQLLGHGLDFNVNLVEPTGPTTFAGPLQPTAQRIITNGYPADTNGFGLAAGLSVVGIDVMNATALNATASATPVASTNLVYTEVRTNLTPGAGRAVFFAINSATIATVGTPDTIQLDIENYNAANHRVFVGDVQVPPASITPISANVIQFPAPAQGPGVFGPVNIRVESPAGTAINDTGELLYTIAENAYSYRRTGPGESPTVSAVSPNTVPDDGTGPVQITGQNFIGPVASGVYSRVWIDGDATFGNGNEFDLSALATGYMVDSISQISFTNFNLDAVDPGPGFLIPRDVPVDVVVEQFDAVNGVVLNDTGGNPLRSRLIGAITFRDAGAAPTITSITPNTGPVSGDDRGAFTVTITGTNFGASEPFVLFGSAQADVTAFTATSITVDLPPAPNGLPGVYDVTVINTTTNLESTAVDGFTYYMDGAPVITQLSPNHINFDPANPPANPDPLFITIIGYNFDDDVRISFTETDDSDVVRLDTVSNANRIRVISPNEIVVQLTTTEWQSILQADDYTGGLATMQVTVQNKADIFLVPTDPDAVSLTSAPVNFFAYDDARGDVTVLTPELLYNDVYLNNQDDYINVSPGTGSISIDPVILGSPWIGKLVPDPVAHPLLNTAGPFTVEPYTLTDFELDARPQGPGAEIGADEIQDIAADTCSWYFARVTPNPVGMTAARQLTIQLQYTGNCGGAPFIVPQGGDPRLAADRIPLELYQNPGNGYFIYTNKDIIETLLDDRDASSGISTGDLIADGHAAIYMQRGNNIIGFDENAGLAPSNVHLTEGGLITGQAVSGRHFLIDTVPPRIQIENAIYNDGEANPFSQIVTGDELVIGSNDQITANDIDAPTHPQGAPPATLPYRPSLVPPPVQYYWPVDDGGITFKDLTGITRIPEGTQIFFNRGSEANPDTLFPPSTVTTGATLETTIVVLFVDPPVTNPTDPTQTPIPGLDFFTGLTNRQVAGFPLSPMNLSEGVGQPPAANILYQGVVRWFPDPTLSLTHGFPKDATYAVSGTNTNNGVFDPSRVPGDSVPNPASPSIRNNDAISATWTMSGLTPIPSQTWRLRAQFVGEDLALNETSNANTSLSAYQTLFDPLQLWWMYDVSSTLTGPSTCEAAPAPFFNVGLMGQRPTHTGQPFPAFTYKLYTSAACAGPYVDSGIPWSNWTLATSIDLLNDLTPAQEAALANSYVMIVSLGADEAGNVEPLRFNPEDPALDVNNLPPNAKTFLFTNQQPADTNVGLEIWVDLDGNGVIDGGEPTFGDNPIVPYDPRLAARYAVSVNASGSVAGPFNVLWSFHEDGVQTRTSPIGPFQSNSDVIATVTPNSIVPANNGGKLGNPNAAVTYLFTAAAFYIDGTGNTIYDPTPASAYFVVVPAGVGDFVLSPEDTNKQPIKEQGKE